VLLTPVVKFRLPSRERMREMVADAVAAQAGRLFLWLPVACGAGAALYLNLRFEPAWSVILAPVVVLIAAAWFMRRIDSPIYLFNIAVLLLMFGLGFGLCKLRAEHVRAPVLESGRTAYVLDAFVVDNISPSAEQPRLLLAPIRMNGVAPENVPLRVRVTLKPDVIEEVGIKPGDAISLFAILNPPPEPDMPGGYDFSQAAWFQGIGGVGMVPGQPQLIPAPKHVWRLDAVMAVNRLRWSITQQLVRDVGGEGGFAAALVSGHQAYISKDLTQRMRDSGLAHILSISGVHMAVVGGFVFFALRFMMVLIPPLALRAPVKKVAAALSIVCVLLYLAISGAPAPAVRSAVVACVAFGAILVDRRAISLRALAIAALIVISLTPEAVIQPGFLMSFSATAALLALAEVIQAPVSEISVPWWVQAFQKTIHGLWLSLVASVVATAATTPFAIAYFNRFSVYSLLSNLFEAPVTTFVVMPFLALGTIFAATPLGWPCLRIADGGLWLIDWIARMTAGLPHAVITWPSAPDFVLPLSFAGLMWACLIKGKVRWLGLVAATAILWWPRLPPPDIWLDPQGGNAAIRASSNAYVLRTKVRQYGFEQWTRRYGLTPVNDTDYLCQGYGCLPLPTARYKVGFWFSNKPPKPERLVQLCQASTVVVMRNPVGDWPAECAGVNHISAGDFDRLGAMELTRKGNAWLIKGAQPLRGQRFWTTPSTADGDQ